jgi:alpha(1,3/1,4) fucosyltransferase
MRNSTDRVALYIDPPSHHFLEDRLFLVDDGRLNGDRILAPYAALREHLTAQGLSVHTADRLPATPTGGRNIYVSLGRIPDWKRLEARGDTVLSAFFALECPIVEPKLYRALPRIQKHVKRVFSWSDSRSLERFLGEPVTFTPFRLPQSFSEVHAGIWDRTDRKLLVMINANKLPRIYVDELYTERLRALAFFGRQGEIDLYGVGWDGPANRVGRTWVPATLRRAERWLRHRWQRLHPDPRLEAARRVYRGPAQSKAEVLGQYTFAICFENMKLRGWVTEKIFDCFFAGTVPVYWGAPDIEAYVPAECFIDMRRFGDYDDLRRYLRSLGPQEVRRYRERVREYLGSPQFRPSTKEAFVEMFAGIIAEDAGATS